MALPALFAAIFGVCFIVVAGMKPRQSKFSLFEAKRRKNQQSSQVVKEYRRATYYGAVLSLQALVATLFLFVCTLCAYAAWGWLGIVVGFILAIFHQRLARMKLTKILARKLYVGCEDRFLTFLERYSVVIRIFSGDDPLKGRTPIASKEEFTHELSQTADWLPLKIRRRLLTNLVFAEKTVKDVMRPARSIVSIDHNELLGPLVLDSLHKTGQTLFLVTAGSLDHVVGVLDIESFLTIDSHKKSLTAEKAMAPPVFIAEEASLEDALLQTLEAKSWLLIAQNKTQKTTGILMLKDIVEREILVNS